MRAGAARVIYQNFTHAQLVLGLSLRASFVYVEKEEDNK
jgi:hypothetical protein